MSAGVVCFFFPAREFNNFWVAFMRDGREDEELDGRLGKASTVMQAQHHLISSNVSF